MAIIVTCWLPVARPVDAQSLADAAKRAEEQRQTIGSAATLVTNGNLAGANGYDALMGDYRLEPTFFTYQSTRKQLIEARKRNRPLDVFLMKHETGTRVSLPWRSPTRRDRRHAPLSFSKIDPRACVMAHVAFQRAMEDAKLSKVDKSQLTPARAANVVLVEDRYQGHNFLAEINRLEKDLASYRGFRR